MGTDGETQNGVGKFFSNWKSVIGLHVIVVSVREMRRNGVMNQRSNAALGKLLLESFAMRSFDDIKMPDGFGPLRNERQHQIVCLG